MPLSASARPPRLPHKRTGRNPDPALVKRISAKVSADFEFQVRLKALQRRQKVSDVIRELLTDWLAEGTNSPH